jgi:3-(3-hydroxy-phenyl)propionate hydroxylase
MSLNVEASAHVAGLTEMRCEVDVLIVGLGPVGAVMAVLLGRQGVRTLAIDAADDIFKAPRAIALDNEALRILQSVGLSETDIDTIAVPFVRMRCPIIGEFARINMLGAINGHPKQVTFYQPQLETVLRAILAKFTSVSVALGTALTGFTEDERGIAARLRNGTQDFDVRARYLVGADGAGSLVRRSMGEEFTGKTYAQDWLVVDAFRDQPGMDHVEFLCDHRRPTPHMVAPGNRERWEFMLRKGESREQIEQEAMVRKLLAPWSGTQELRLERKAVYRFHARVATRFSKGRVFLVGDAAHITPPFIGQGLVAGLRDATNLSWKLVWAAKGLAGCSILDTYDQERRPHAVAMIRLAKFMGKMVMPRNALLAFINHGLMSLIHRVPHLRDFVEELGIKPKNRFRKGLFRTPEAGSKLVAGGLIPQGWVRAQNGCVQLSDEALGGGFVLMGFGCNPGLRLERDVAREFSRIAGKLVQIAFRGQRLGLAESEVYEDLEGAFLPGIAKAGWVAVIRPDRVIMHAGPADRVNQIVRECLELLQVTSSAASSTTASSKN